MANAAAQGQLKLFRHLLREIRLTNHKGSLQNHPAYSYVVEQFRKHQVTSKKICRGEEEMRHLGDTYLCLLQSSRKYEEINQQNKGKGERTVEESARLVGLNLPKNDETL